MPQKLSDHRKQLLRNRAAQGKRPIEPIPPDLIGVSYSKRLQAEADRGFKLVEKLLFPVLEDDIERLDSVRADIGNDADTIQAVIARILKRFFGGMFSKDKPNLTGYGRTVKKKLVEPMLKQTDRHNKTQFSKTFKRVSGVDPLAFAPGLNEFLDVAGEQNVNLIVTQSSNYFDSIQEMTNRALRKGTSVSELRDDIIALTGTTKSKAKLIAIDQVQKLNADLEGQRQQNNGLTRYIWRTRQNARVRSKDNSGGVSDHRGLEGAVIDWNFPPITVLTGKRAGERNSPGQDINCKCWSEPVIEDLTGKRTKQLEAAETITRKLISQGRIPGYTLTKISKAS